MSHRFETPRSKNRYRTISVINEISKTTLYMTDDVRIDSLEGCYKNHADYFNDFVSLNFWDDLEPHAIEVNRAVPSSPKGLVVWPLPSAKESECAKISNQIIKFSNDIRKGLSRKLDDEVNISISIERRRTKAEVVSFRFGTSATRYRVQANCCFVDVSAFDLARRSFARLGGVRSPRNFVDALARILDQDAESLVLSGLEGSFVWDAGAWATIEREFCRALCRDRLIEGNFFGASEIGKQKFSRGVDLIPKQKFLGRVDDQALQISARCCPVLDGVYEGALLSVAEGLRMGIDSIPGGRLDSMGKIYYPDSCFRFRVPAHTDWVPGRRTIKRCKVCMVDCVSLTGDLIIDWDDGFRVHTVKVRVDLPRLVSMSNCVQRGAIMTHDIECVMSEVR